MGGDAGTACSRKASGMACACALPRALYARASLSVPITEGWPEELYRLRAIAGQAADVVQPQSHMA